MGGIVKSIGKAIKGIGKLIKKILPILLVAAAVYIGYGYMTGFQAGGWPQITNWGKSLVAGVGQGQTISQAATAATDMTAIAGAETAAIGAEAVTTALPAQEAVISAAIPGADVASAVAQPVSGMIGQTADVASTVAETGGLIGDGMGMPGGAPPVGDGMGLPAGEPPANWALDSIAQTQPGLTDMYSKFDAGWADTTKGVLDSLASPAQAAGFGPNTPPFLQGGSTYVPELGGASPMSTDLGGIDLGVPGGDIASINQAAADKVMAGGPTWTPDTLTGTGPGLSTLPPDPRLAQQYSPNQFLSGSGNISHLAASEKGTFFSKLAQLGKKGWEAYKKMWADNPGMAMWTTSNVLKTILAMLDRTDEKLAHRRAHVGGFEPGGYDALAARYGGNLPGGRGGGGGFSGAGASGGWAPRGRSRAIKTGPIPEAGRSRSSAINRPSPGIIGNSTQGQV
jgi:hypothetical protein